MTENERKYLEKVKKIHLLRDLLEGDINRICVTDSLAEYGNMGISAKKHLDRLMDMAYEALMIKLAEKEEE